MDACAARFSNRLPAAPPSISPPPPPLFFSLPPLPGSYFAPPAAWSVQSVLGVAVLAHRSVWALWSLSSAAAAAVPLPVLVRPLLLFQCRRGRVCARVCALVSLSGHLAAPTPYFLPPALLWLPLAERYLSDWVERDRGAEVMEVRGRGFPFVVVCAVLPWRIDVYIVWRVGGKYKGLVCPVLAWFSFLFELSFSFRSITFSSLLSSCIEDS